MTDEQWRDVPGYPGLQASDSGRVRSATVEPPTVLRAFRYGPYLHVQVPDPRTGRDGLERVHRLVLLAFAGPPAAAGLVYRRLTGDPLDNRAVNLAWGSRSENQRDAVRHGTANCLRRGGRHPSAKLTDAEYAEVGRQARAGGNPLVLAKRFGISPEYVIRIGTGRNVRRLSV